MTACGAERLEAELANLRSRGNESERIAELERILGSVEVVAPPDGQSNSVFFGAKVRVSDGKGQTENYRIVGVDELDFELGAVSWISPFGKALLASELGGRVTLEDGRTATVVKIE